VLRGGSEQFIDEADRSLHDAIMIVRRALKHSEVVPGGGAIEMEVISEGFMRGATDVWVNVYGVNIIWILTLTPNHRLARLCARKP
jgi:hypothetical protein